MKKKKKVSAKRIKAKVLKKKPELKKKVLKSKPVKKSSPKPESNAPDKKKRLFLKFLGLAGLGFLGSMLLPKKADALVFGSTPASNVVGVKDSNNIKINPAKEETLALVATEATLATIKTDTGKLKYDVDGNLLTANAGASVVGINNATNARINPATQETVANLATDENLVLLRRIAKQIDSLATVDSAQRQRVAVEAMPTTTVTGTITAVTAVNGFGATTVLPNLTALGGVDARFLYTDTARNAYANGLRNNL